MQTTNAVLVLVAMGAVLMLIVMVIALQQAEHRKTGLLPGPDPRASTEALLDAVLGAVPVGQVRQGSVAFEDGSGLLLAEPDRPSLIRLSRLAQAGEVFLDKVYEMSVGWRLVFRSANSQTYVDVGAWHLVAPTVRPA